MDTSLLAVQVGDLSHGRGPLYQRLADRLRTAIGGGVLGAASRLPSERDLATALAVSRTTVIAAYRVLREDGLLEAAQGSGTRVAATGPGIGPSVPAAVTPATKLVSEPLGDAIDLSASVIPNLDGLPQDLLRLTADDFHGTGLDYAPLGLPALRAAIAARYTRLGLPTTPAEVLVTTGGQQAISLLFTLFGRDGGTIVTENPTYAGALDAAHAAGARVVGLPTDSEGIRVTALRSTVDRTAVRLVYLMSAGHNPTGAVMSAARKTDIAHLLAQAGIPVVDDATLADLAFHGTPPAPFTITVGSLSKVCWPGLRVGWIRAPEHLIARMANLKVVADLGSAQPSQLLAARLLPALDRIASVRRQQLQHRHDLLTALLRERLPDWTWPAPRGGPFLWVRLPAGDSTVFGQIALRHGVRVLPGARTTPDGMGNNHLRISCVAEPAELPVAVDRLSRAWAAFRSAPGLSVDVVV
nr:PLP-dependent aminotransferase family protein [Kibdelosporangium sp. MJ126-NF4]CEL13845.1 Transcriptional regulator, GntR family domain / Aspartate aminotransferase [Kibdelosporangium sp. MJ126-NF4]CTQ88213.1 Transcriptional regulator, GntR family domain / Aspartate aminotransferase (EC 2.6.1.1) [Kibdelosporangium sp. MJ126-NF4]